MARPGLLFSRTDFRPPRDSRCRSRNRGTCAFRVACPGLDDPMLGSGESAAEVVVGHEQSRIENQVLWEAAKFGDIAPSQVVLQMGSSRPERAVPHLNATGEFSVRGVAGDRPCARWNARIGHADTLPELGTCLRPASTRIMENTGCLYVEIDHSGQRVVRIPVFVFVVRR